MNQSEEIKSAEEILTKHSAITSNKWVADKSELISIIHEYANQFKSEWVSVKDRLPEPFVRVLVIDDDLDCFIDLYSDNEILSNEKWEFYTHWQPLPTPPEV